jgi:LytTr DNA-binding domain
MSLMLSAVHAGTPSFWRLQAVAWTLTYVLLLLAALPHLTERDIFRYNTVGCAVLFCLTLGIRPLSRAASTRWRYSWLALQACALVLSLFLGMFASFAIGLGTFGWARLNGSNWMLSWLQCGAVIFLWCNLYISIKQWRLAAGSISATSAIQQVAQEYATQFAIKAGSRIQVVPERKVLWVSAARDYAELHTSSGTFLLRETMQSLEQRLDPSRFVRIHRSRIVRWDQITELTKQEDGEYRVKLLDGTVHRSSRTYAPTLDGWIRSGVRNEVRS